ncbi:MAG: hypothetical protein JXK07_06940 [Spirochaetes bacterium]|nr:hypothetical protein [Spirochaetota bacterium]MBN2769483.1 hypothetical protein [Spirochaetota bacterium]
MTKETIQENDIFSLYYYPQYGIIHHEVHTNIYGEAFKTMLTAGADMFIKNRCNKWLSNDKSSQKPQTEDLIWAYDNWKDRVVNHGWKYWALVMPDRMTGQIDMQKIAIGFTGLGVEVQTFNNPDMALTWLKKA